jgi:DNA-binding PadR family transcriptional regulator
MFSPDRREGMPAWHILGRMLPATGYAVLGLLSFGKALSGYELKRWADHSLRYFFWSPAQSAIYTELRRLEEFGYARPVGQAEGPRGRQRYRITAAGKRALSEWVTKDHALLKVWLGHAADRDSLLAVVAAERKAAEDLHDEVQYSAGQAEAAQYGYAALVEQFCERVAAARLAALEELAAGLSATDRTDVPD